MSEAQQRSKAQRKLDKEMAKYRDEMKKKMASSETPLLSDNQSTSPTVASKRQSKKKPQHSMQADANSLEQTLKDAWAAVPPFWAKPKGKTKRRPEGKKWWVWVVAFCVILWLLVAGFMPTTSTASRRGSPLQSRPEVLAQLSGKSLTLTNHGECRMQCRKVSEADVKLLLATGLVNDRKSDPAASPCPVYALETKASASRRIRAVVSSCAYEWSVKVITVIDLTQDHKCWCP